MGSASDVIKIAPTTSIIGVNPSWANHVGSDIVMLRHTLLDFVSKNIMPTVTAQTRPRLSISNLPSLCLIRPEFIAGIVGIGGTKTSHSNGVEMILKVYLAVNSCAGAFHNY
jgi:hypothetical protein